MNTATNTTGTLPVALAEENQADLEAALASHGLPGFLGMPDLLAATNDLEELLDGVGITSQSRVGLTMSLSTRLPTPAKASIRREAQGWAVVALEGVAA